MGQIKNLNLSEMCISGLARRARTQTHLLGQMPRGQCWHTQGSDQMLDIIPCKLRHRFMPPLRPAMPRVKISTRHHYVEMLNMPKLDSLSLQIVFYTAGKTSVTQAGSLVWVDRPIICTITSVLTHQLSWQYVISQFKSSLKAYTDTQK